MFQSKDGFQVFKANVMVYSLLSVFPEKTLAELIPSGHTHDFMEVDLGRGARLPLLLTAHTLAKADIPYLHAGGPSSLL